MHLRMCMECGKISCCDDSPNRHASSTRTRSRIRCHHVGRASAGDWRWCYIAASRSYSDEVALDGKWDRGDLLQVFGVDLAVATCAAKRYIPSP